MIARGPAIIPSDGVGMIAEWTSAAVRQHGGVERTQVTVVAIDGDPSGGAACGRPTAASSPQPSRSCSRSTRRWRTAAGRAGPATASRLPEGRILGHRGVRACVPALPRRRDRDERDPAPDRRSAVDLVCQTSNVTRPACRDGPHILLAMRVTTGGVA